MDAPQREDAERLLTEAGGARERLAGRGRPIRVYLLGYAVTTLVVFPIVGLAGYPADLIAVGALIAITSALGWWAQRRPVTERGGNRRKTLGSIGWVLLYLVAAVIGLELFPGEPGYWIPAAVVVAAPLVLAALLPTRR